MSIPDKKRIKRKKTHSITRYGIALFILAAIMLVFLFSGEKKPWQHQKIEPQPPATQVIAPSPTQEQTVDEKIKEQAAQKNYSPQQSPPSVVKSSASSAVESIPLPVDQQTTKASQCEDLATKLHRFFSALDNKPYIKAVNLQTSLQTHFINLVDSLLDNPPTVARETDDLYTLLTNMAHFFRIIGKDNILLLKSILDRERDVIEDIGLVLYTWITVPDCSSDLFPLKAPLDKSYEYAGFFLNTMGGRSYLFRRDSRSRLLVNYYAVLIVDKANSAGINRHGISIADTLPLLIDEIEASNQLVYKELYLDRLYQLLETYQ